MSFIYESCSWFSTTFLKGDVHLYDIRRWRDEAPYTVKSRTTTLEMLLRFEKSKKSAVAGWEWIGGSMKRTTRVMLGKDSVSNNSRKLKAANIDSERTSQNIP